jgi:iron complex transport system substrate-binding protein
MNLEKADLRIVSLIPSATELVAALGFEKFLVGRSHECDYPKSVLSLPICTAPNLNPQGSSQEIHQRVTALLESALSIYRVDLEILEQLQPTHIITQAQCEVCAVSLSQVEEAVAQWGSQPQLISLQPSTLGDIWQDLRRVGTALGQSDEAIAQLVQKLQARVNFCQQQSQSISERPKVACIEWTQPLMAAGNWVPELVELAGGQNLFGAAGKHSPWLKWDDLLQADPDLLVIMPCGFNLQQTRQAVEELAQDPEWHQLKAVQTNQIYLVDGNQYFNRPGPRLVDSLEILAEIFHPWLYKFGYQGQGWMALETLASDRGSVPDTVPMP